LYKRTNNKVEWSILDFGGHETYKSLYPIFLSSIDHQFEPTLFVIVYNHSEYSSESHQQSIGAWIEAIINNSRTISDTQIILIKLIGLVRSALELNNKEENESKLKLVLSNCEETVEKINEKLSSEKMRIKSLIENKDNNQSNNKESSELYRKAGQLLDTLLNRKLKFVEDINLVDSGCTRRENMASIIASLEHITIGMNYIVPLELKGVLRNHISKLKINPISLDEFTQSLDENEELKALIQKYPKCQLNLEKILYYSKTMSEIFWLKYHKQLSKTVFNRYSYIINCLKLFVRHDENSLLNSKFDEQSLFKKLSLYKSEDEFNNSVALFRNYGILEHSLLKAICFDEIQLDRIQIEEMINFLNQIQVVYKSFTHYLEEKCTFFQIVLPTMCKRTFSMDKKESDKINSENWTAILFDENYEMYFIRLDQIRKHKNEIKSMNALRKQRALWSSSSGDPALETEMFFNVYEMEENPNGNKSRSDSALLESLISPLDTDTRISEIKEFKFRDESEYALKYKDKFKIELHTIFNFDTHLFCKFASLLQDLFYERFDWHDTIISRDVNDNFFKINIENKENSNGTKIIIEIKYVNKDELNALKKRFFDEIYNLFDFYPGIYFYVVLKKD
jgi:hypothetical protein